MIPYCEKYRAKCFADIKGQEQAIALAQEMLKSQSNISIILNGPP